MIPYFFPKNLWPPSTFGTHSFRRKCQQPKVWIIKEEIRCQTRSQWICRPFSGTGRSSSLEKTEANRALRLAASFGLTRIAHTSTGFQGGNTHCFFSLRLNIEPERLAINFKPIKLLSTLYLGIPRELAHQPLNFITLYFMFALSDPRIWSWECFGSVIEPVPHPASSYDALYHEKSMDGRSSGLTACAVCSFSKQHCTNRNSRSF